MHDDSCWAFSHGEKKFVDIIDVAIISIKNANSHIALWPAAACSNGAHFATPHNDINGHPPSIIGS
tara:strand:+ start:596 stop:793 length:198 start_codon:yes stop_codon:yes gene_type:complete